MILCTWNNKYKKSRSKISNCLLYFRQSSTSGHKGELFFHNKRSLISWELRFADLVGTNGAFVFEGCNVIELFIGIIGFDIGAVFCMKLLGAVLWFILFGGINIWVWVWNIVIDWDWLCIIGVCVASILCGWL